MKRLLLTLMLLPATLAAQTEASDSAATAVDRYLQMLNPYGLPKDSMLVMETVITTQGDPDTLRMTRWFAEGEMFRVEVRHDDELLTGLCSNGQNRHRQYNSQNGWWEDLPQEELTAMLVGYDWRGPLFDWRRKGALLTWNGTSMLKGHKMLVVKVVMPGMYDRNYLFDAQTGLLTLVVESATENGTPARIRGHHIEWRSMHEYMPLGESLIPSLESFVRNKTLTVLATTMHLEKTDTHLFNRDK